MITGKLTVEDGSALHTMTWPAEVPRGRLLFVHGFGEHGARYHSLGTALAKRGYSCFAYDQRGHGRSAGRRGHASSFDVFLEDMASAIAEAERTLPGPGELFLYGHSMGGLVVCRYLQTRHPRAAGAIVSAPWLGTGVPVPWWKELAAGFLRRVAPGVRVSTEIDAGALTADETLQQVYLNDPLIGHTISITLYDAVREAQRLCLQAPLPDIPTMFLLPQLDRVVDGRRTEAWLETSGKHVKLVRLPGVLHEPHNDVGREDVYRLVAEWLDSRTRDAGTG